MTRKQGIIARIVRRHGAQARARGRILKHLAKKLNLVYFGTVDQHEDEHDVIRGLTVSTTHRDEHYAVGAYDGYDISLVDRFDVLVEPDGKSSHHSWVILQIDLQTDEHLPHMFLRPLGHSQNAYARFFRVHGHLQPVNTQLLDTHAPDFHGRYELYGGSSHLLTIERIFSPQTTQVIAARAWPHAIEVFENKLYVYTTDEKLTEALLTTALETGLWLARVIDQ